MHFRYSKYQKEISLAGDLLFLNLFFLAGYFFTFNGLNTLLQSNYFELLLYLNIAWTFSAFLLQVHDTTRTTNLEIVLRRLINALGLYLLFIFAFIGIKGDEFYKLYILQSYFLTALGISFFEIGFILFLKYYRRIGYNYRRVLVIGYGEIARELRKFFIFHPEHGYKFYGYFDDNFSGPTIRGKVKDVASFAKENLVDEIYCCLPYLKPENVHELGEFAEDNFIKFKVVPDYRGIPFKGFEVQLFDYIPVLNIRPQPLEDQFNRFLKRSFDIIFSFLVIAFVLWWLMPLIGLIIKLDSKGPVFFNQYRHGKDNKSFLCYKFRTMNINHESDSKQATKNDPRITKIGQILRKTSIDEIPQFINVFLGDMSVIGPRPHPLKLNEVYKPQIEKYTLRHWVCHNTFKVICM